MLCPWLIYYLYCMFAFTDELFPFIIFMFLVVAFSFSVTNPFNISCKAGLVVVNSFSFCLYVKLYISPSNLNESHAGSSILGSMFLPFITLKWQVVCQYFKYSNVPDTLMLRNIFQALNVYYNYSGQAKCLNVSETATSSLGVQGWSYQVSVYNFPNWSLLFTVLVIL